MVFLPAVIPPVVPFVISTGRRGSSKTVRSLVSVLSSAVSTSHTTFVSSVSLGNNMEFISELIARVTGVKFDLTWQVITSVFLFEHAQGGDLGVTEVVLGVSIIDTLGDGLLINTTG
mmetsp:Transcript_7464/g.7363  ORF Transcript_7464/g.7363 Transcript_7464/m.7363 type:complete len:117 (+) Transcript_7464:306-656(+)